MITMYFNYALKSTYKLRVNDFLSYFQLTLVDTVGYGDQINKEDNFNPIISYVDQQFEAYLQEELRIERCLSMYHDSRIHVCLYFISPTGHG